MSKSLGTLLQLLRKEHKIKQKTLSKGICSVATLSRIEAGEREPDYLLFDALFTRMGKDSRKWEFILKENDKYLLRKRNYIEYLLQVKRWEETEREIETYTDFMEVSKNLHEQYHCMIEGILYYKRGNRKKALEKYIEALQKTNLEVDVHALQIESILSRNELRILCLIGQVLSEEEEMSIESLYHYWKELLQYIEKYCTDEWYRMRFHVKTIYYLAYTLYRQENYMESFSYCKKGIDILVEKMSLYYLKSFLHLLENLKEKGINFTVGGIVWSDKIPFLIHILEEWELENQRFQEKENYIRPYQSIYSINEIIKNTSSYCGKTQEDFMETKDGKKLIVDQAGMSQIEHGKREPRKEIIQHCFKTLGLQGKEERYQLQIQGEDFEIQELKWNIDFYISVHKKEKAKELYKILKEKIDIHDIYNEQYVRHIDVLLKDSKSDMSDEEYRKEIFDILALTVKDIDKIRTKEWSYFFTIEELVLLMNIGGSYHKSGNYREALHWYQKLERYFQNFYKLAGTRIYKSLLYNLSQAYGLLGEYKNSIKKSKACIFTEMLYDQGHSMCRAIFNIGWCYGKMMLVSDNEEEKEEYRKYCNKYFLQSSCIAEIYQDLEVIEVIKEKRNLWEI